jgi:hypothetical protein
MSILLMSADKFRKLSHKTFSRGRGPIVRDIEKLLRLFEETDRARRRLKILGLLYIWCKSYTGTRGGVHELLNEVTETILMDRLFPQATHTAPTPFPCVKLQDIYRFEPFLPGKKTMGGEELDLECDLHESFFRVNIPSLLQLLGLKHRNKAPKEVEKMFAELNFCEVLDLYLEFQTRVAKNDQELTVKEFETCTKNDRDIHRLYLHDGKFYSNKELTTLYTSPQHTIYVVDGDFNFYAFPGTIGKDFNHSSFLSGRPVMCGGNLDIQQGCLKYIDNRSGHYRPSEKHLGIVVVNLSTYGVRLRDVEVSWSEKNKDGSSEDDNKKKTFAGAFLIKHLAQAMELPLLKTRVMEKALIGKNVNIRHALQ